MVEVFERLSLMREQRRAEQLRTVNSGSAFGPPNTTLANRAHQAQERKPVRLRGRERKQAHRGQEDEQRRKDRQARGESAAQALLRYEVRKAQEAEQRQAFFI